MIIILHGEDDLASRNRLQQIIDISKSKNQSISKYEAKDLDLTTTVQLLESPGLFGSTILLVIFNFFSLPVSAQKTKLLTFFRAHQDSSLVFWEGKPINATTLKSFSGSKIETFKTNPIVFAFLDQLYPGNLPKIISLYENLLANQTPPEFIFAMLIRQIRLLISALSDPLDLKLSPWQKTRLINQSKKFKLPHLLSLHQSLYKVDKELKTGTNPLDLESQILNILLKF